ncbi:MAG: hypothetical protein AB1455_01095 [Pseudomonadota bacterium]
MNALALVIVGALAGNTHATPYSPPVAGSSYTYSTTSSGEVTIDILSTEDGIFTTRSKRQRGSESEERRLFGIYSMSKQFNEGILSRDLAKASEFFPLQIGKKVVFDTYGQTNGPRWYRSQTWETVRQYSLQIGQDNHQVYVIKVLSESPGYFKLDGTCDYSVVFAACIKVEGDLFVRGRPELTGPQSSYMTKAVVRGMTLTLPDLQKAVSPAQLAAPAPAAVAPAVAPAPATVPTPAAAAPQPAAPAPQPAASPAPASPTSNQSPGPGTPAGTATSAEQRLKQAKELLDKKLITQQQYDEFVARIMKDM